MRPEAAPDAGVLAGRLPPERHQTLFDDAHPPLTPVQAQIEADRCYYCVDAPCVNACPT